ncbi:molybdopterin oxidoreductase family protein [Belnapia sp. T6]|uniref:Molybdopterin oxidoreductase family protein n=1 Tax=Belnapia mucosa TaxID=2804532 RepID=A0ABS1V6H1_9PROT|nr:molybdopterin oxidoreductase family protein [Belnapia mucosa]MBL6457212.1 molybdopterin oxidoreductase family protein [Belnapia mucosa]
MDGSLPVSVIRTACPHDCPSACVLEVERLSATRIGRVRGSASYDYTAGTCCAKVARYAERVHHPARLTRPLLRIGAKGEGRFAPIPWEEALDRIAEAFRQAAARDGAEAVWPYHSGGTMGVLARWGLDRLRHVMGYSRQKSTICVTPAESGWRAGHGAARGADPRLVAEADLILMWGGNPVSTQVNLMAHIQQARKRRGAKLVVVDAYRSPSIEAADLGIILRPGTDAALALAMMAVALERGAADRGFLAAHTDWNAGVEAHLRRHTPDWAEGITGVPAATIRALAEMYAGTRRMFLRAGVGFTRHRNGAATMHAISCLAALTGAWAEEGGGAFFYALEGWGLDTRLAWASDRIDPRVRVLDQSRIGAVLNGEALAGGPPVTAMLIQNANSAEVAPDSAAVRRGLARRDLFLAVHEQFMTPTAALADVVLPATTFLEQSDLYLGLGHTALTVGPRVIAPLGEARSNHAVVCALAARLGAEHPGFGLEEEAMLDATLRASGLPGWEEAKARGHIPVGNAIPAGPDFAGFPQPDGRFRFRPDWAALGPHAEGMPELPSHWERLEAASAATPFRLITPPARSFLNTSFTETPGSRSREGMPRLRLHPADAGRLGIADGAPVRIGNARGALTLHAMHFDGVLPGVVAVEGISPSADFPEGIGINALIGAEPVAPAGGVAFHDTAVWVQPA